MQSPHSNQLVLYFSKLQQPPWLSLSNWNLPLFHPHHYAEQQKVQQTKPKEQGDVAHRRSCFSQFVTSSARPDSLSLKSIKRILDGVYLESAHARLLPNSCWLLLTVTAKSCQTLMRGWHISLWTYFFQPWAIIVMQKEQFDTYHNAVPLHLNDIQQQVFGTQTKHFSLSSITVIKVEYNPWQLGKQIFG